MPEINGNIVVLNPCSTYGAGSVLCVVYEDGKPAEFADIEEIAQLLS